LVHAEVIDPKTQKHSDKGELHVTNLFNLCTPIIRYNLGDWVHIDNGYCSCGWTTPTISSLHGRTSTVLEYPDGRVVSAAAFFALPRKIPAILQYQIIQYAKDQIECRVILENRNQFKSLETQISNVCREIINNPEINVTIKLVESMMTLGAGQKSPSVIPLSQQHLLKR
jgi:phenylacetate-coenzyme A ligase PaaK-like adenylate-forming protein